MKKATVNKDELLINYITETASPAERDEAVKWISASKENYLYYKALEKLWVSPHSLPGYSDYNSVLSWERLRARYYRNAAERLKSEKSDNRLYFTREILKYAAIIVIFSSLAFSAYKFLKVNNLQSDLVWHEVEAPFGSRSKVILADGSSIWLNSGSVLRYSSGFGTENREVYLKGEAYFEVSKDESKQFIVRTSHLDVKVFGTKFNVKAYPEENVIQTTLVEGSVVIEGEALASSIKHIELLPNQTATVRIRPDSAIAPVTGSSVQIKEILSESKVSIDSIVNTDVYTSWKDHRWVIEGEDLESLAVKLERRYNIKIEITNESLKRYKFTGILKDETLEQVLNVIKISAPVDFRISENLVFLSTNHTFKKGYDEMLINKPESLNN